MIEIDEDTYKELVLMFYVLCIAGAVGAAHRFYILILWLCQCMY